MGSVGAVTRGWLPGSLCDPYALPTMPPERGPGFESPLARFAPYVLGVAMVASAVFSLYVGRGTTFTPDEWFWLVSTPGMTFETLFQTSTGHLQLVPRAVYKILLELDGTNYFWFRLLSVASLLLMVGLLYRWLVDRVGAMVALVPCIVLLFFGSDAVHLIRGNGFTIIFSIVCGLGALMVLERNTLRGDVAACLLLCLGLATYTVALPFVAGAGVSLLLLRHWRRLWVPVVPLVLYGIWKLWLSTAGPQSWGGELHLSNVTRIPEWIFDALSSVLSAVTGIGYGLTDITDSGPDDVFGPILAGLFLIAVVWRITRGGGVSRPLWVAFTVGVSLWAIQCMASDPAFPEFRTADETRYLYPGAVAVFMIGAELVAGKRWSLPAYLALVAVGAFGLASNIQQALTYGERYRDDATQAKILFAATSIKLDDQLGKLVEPGPEPVFNPTFDGLTDAMARRPFGGVGYAPEEIPGLSADKRNRIDEALVGAGAITVSAPGGAAPAGCRPVPPGSGGIELRPGRVAIRTAGGSTVLIGRYGDEPSVPLELPSPKGGVIDSPTPLDGVPYRIAATGDAPDLEICKAADR